MCLVLQPTKWLAKTLGLSVTTIKKFRKERPNELPPAIKIGSSYRYNEKETLNWIQERQNQSVIKESS